MSKTSYFLIGIIVAALLYMGAARLHEWRAQRLAVQEDALRNDGEPFSFQQVPVSLAAPEAELMKNPVQYQPQYQEIYLEDAVLSAEQQMQQAQDTIVSIMQDFANEPALQEFNRELQAASAGDVQNLADLSTQNLEQILQKNPEIQQVVSKHLKDQDFSKLVQQIFNNPQFQQSVQELQGPSHTVPRQSAQ